MKTIREFDLDGNLSFLTAPEDQGQTIEVSYAGMYDGRVMKRVHNRAELTTRHYVADLDPDEQERDEPCGLNREPVIDSDSEWVEVDFVPSVGQS